MTKQTSKCYAPETLKDKFEGVNVIKNFLDIDQIPPALERSFKATIKLSCELPKEIEMESIPIMELSSLNSWSISTERREPSQNTDLDMPEFLGIDKSGNLKCQNRKAIQTQVARMRQTTEKVVDEDTFWQRIRTLFREQGITIIKLLTTLSLTISTIGLIITGVFGG